jgi:hypothetical protein
MAMYAGTGVSKVTVSEPAARVVEDLVRLLTEPVSIQAKTGALPWRTQMSYLSDLADDLDGAGWKHLHLEEMSPLQRQAFEAATDADRLAWLDWSMHEPLPVEHSDDGEILTISSPRGAVLWRCDPRSLSRL